MLSVWDIDKEEKFRCGRQTEESSKKGK